MAVARNTIPHLRMVFGGTTGSAGQEIWACTLKLVPTNAGPPIVPKSQADAETSVLGLERADLLSSAASMLTPLQTLWSQIGGYSFYLDYLKLNAFGSNDMQVTDPTVTNMFTPVEGGIPCSTPWSTALDLYHRTTVASRGFASHGRMSFPTGLSVNGATGKINLLGTPSGSPYATLATAATDYAAFLAALPALSPFMNWYPAIVYTSTTSAKPPRANVINRIIASDIPGEVRTRENALVQGSGQTTVSY